MHQSLTAVLDPAPQHRTANPQMISPSARQTLAEPFPAPHRPLALGVIIPTYNERSNIAELISRLELALEGITWELIFVDDDSPDDTASLIATYARQDPRIRLLHRVNRRGLSSACIEGMLATTATFLAVMDADMQHDEAILPAMYVRLCSEGLDLVVGTRNGEGGSMGEFCSRRRLLSRLGRSLSQTVCRCSITDPMSGFFVIRRQFFLDVAHDLQGGGFKILVDILSSARRPVHFAEVGYTFRLRRSGESKLDVNTAIEYLFLLIHKLTRGAVPTRFAAFSLVGLSGIAIHLLSMTWLLFVPHWRFLPAQIAATYAAMTANFFLNNLVTWRDRSLRGLRLVSGLASFYLVCSFGAWANTIFARALLQGGARWYLAGAAGILLSSVWNYSMANLFTWQKIHKKNGPEASLLESDALISRADSR